MQKQVEYAEAVKTKYPEQVVIVIAKDKEGKANPVTLGWTMIASGNPPMMAVAVAAGHYTVKAVEHSKCFTIVYGCSLKML
jgi:flavin reductase (DIM6/NTAB) family NADH-FMN oxidoreductase RutF